jgi:N-acetylglucosaminyldiphosphoundecaprenol N-acetyl-beta-D-mannosaminyltransferase
MNPRLTILDIWVDPVDRQAALVRAEGFLRSEDGPHAVFASNPEKQFTVPKDPLLCKVYREASLLLPDGIGMVLAARILHGVRLERVPGSEFIFDLCGLAERQGLGIFVYGAKEEVNRKAVERLQARFPGLVLAGRQNGYLPEAQIPALIETINRSNARILFLALGSPKQEKWYAAHRHMLKNVKICQGIGGTLDTIAGTVRRAPAAWCRLNLEWLYRLLSEPKRIGRQRVLPIFAAQILVEAIKSRLLKTNMTS